MTELTLQRDGVTHCIRVAGDMSLPEAAQTLERWHRDWMRAKRKATA